MQSVQDAMTDRDRQAELLALAVHEFRTPVTVVCGYLRMLAREQLGPLNERQHKLVEESERSCARLGALVAELSELANLDADAVTLASQDVAMRTLLDEAAQRVDDGQDRAIVVEIRGASDGLTVSGDRARLAVAFTALLRAVVREQTEPGRVCVDVDSCDVDGRPHAAVTIGRDAELPAVKNPTPGAVLNEFRGGLGLSLPIARRVIDRHGGRVWSSAEGRLMGPVAVWLPLKENRS